MIGALVPVDAKAGTVAVKAKGKELSLTAGTKAAKEALDKFKKGDRVRVFYTEADGKLLALRVEEARAKPKVKRTAKNKAAAKKK